MTTTACPTFAACDFADAKERWFVHYMLFGYQRVGEASGLTRFGEHRWFDEGAEFLIDTQAYDGSWHGMIDETVATGYSLLFLSHKGARPWRMQKLQLSAMERAAGTTALAMRLTSFASCGTRPNGT